MSFVDRAMFVDADVSDQPLVYTDHGAANKVRDPQAFVQTLIRPAATFSPREKGQECEATQERACRDRNVGCVINRR